MSISAMAKLRSFSLFLRPLDLLIIWKLTENVPKKISALQKWWVGQMMRSVVRINFQKWPLKKKVWPPLVYIISIRQIKHPYTLCQISLSAQVLISNKFIETFSWQKVLIVKITNKTYLLFYKNAELKQLRIEIIMNASLRIKIIYLFWFFLDRATTCFAFYLNG